MSNTKNDELVLTADPRVLAIHIIDNGEPMLDLKDQTDIVYGPSPEVPNNTDYTKLRKTVYEKLNSAQKLLPKGLRFCLYEGYRSLDLQKMLFEARFDKVTKQHPNWTQEDIFNETIKLIAPVTNLDGSVNIPPHSTGAAVDVYLIDSDANPLDMGIHPKDWMQDDDGSISLTASRIISPDAQKNREIMSAVLTEVGFVNYPTEYWHWSYGDRYWAFHKNRTLAFYGTHVMANA